MRSQLVLAIALWAGSALPAAAADPPEATLSVVYTFRGGTDGANPASGLTLSGDTLYGTTYIGGAGNGTVFGIDSKTGVETLLADLPNVPGEGNPETTPIDIDRVLYGAAQGGWQSKKKFGILYKVAVASGKESTLHVFHGGSDASPPWSGPIAGPPGTLFGANDNFLFSFNPANKLETPIYSFSNAAKGSEPNGNIVYQSGLIYGTTAAGGTSHGGYGTIYSVDPNTGAEAVLYKFTDGSDGAYPIAGLISAGGNFYGTTNAGGANNLGTMFEWDTTSSRFRTIYTFAMQTGGHAREPGVLLYQGGFLYVVTTGWLNESYAEILKIKATTGVASVFYAFASSAIQEPNAGLVFHDGAYYGTAELGGSANCPQGCGVVYKLVPPAR